MTRKDLDNLEEMYAKAVLASKGEGDYQDPKAKEKAETLKKLISLVEETDPDDYVPNEEYVYRTRDRRDFLLALYSWKMVGALYDILCWNRAIYNGKDYGEGSVIYRNKLYTAEEWHKMTDSFFGNDTEVDYDWDKKVYRDKDGEVPQDEVHFVYTRDQVNDKLDELLSDVYDFVYNFME